MLHYNYQSKMKKLNTFCVYAIISKSTEMGQVFNYFKRIQTTKYYSISIFLNIVYYTCSLYFCFTRYSVMSSQIIFNQVF